MKRSELVFTGILVPLDYLLVFLAAWTAYEVRIGWFAALRPVIFEIPLKDYLEFAALVAVVFVAMFALAGLYAVSGPRRLTIEVSRIFLASSTAIMGVIVLIFFRGELFNSRFIVLAAWLIAFLYVALGRIVVRLVQRLLLRADIGVHRVALVGGGDETTATLMRELSRRPSFGFRVVKRIEAFDDAARAELLSLREAGQLDEIIVSSPDVPRDALSALMTFARDNHLGFRYSADLLATHAHNMEISALAGIPVIEIKGTSLDGWGRIYKRVFDILGSLVLIVLTSPIMLLTALAIMLDTKGPVLFSRRDDGAPVTRIGQYGAPFPYFKFRSMRVGTDSQRYKELSHLDTRADGPLVKLKGDPRITRVGKFIRRFSIDELPEFFLVLTGKMSLVGPRPHLPEEIAKYRSDQRRVLIVKPGITGLAQVSGRSDLPFDDEIRLDMYYVENWSPWLDFAILIRTPFAVLGGRQAS